MQSETAQGYQIIRKIIDTISRSFAIFSSQATPTEHRSQREDTKCNDIMSAVNKILPWCQMFPVYVI